MAEKEQRIWKWDEEGFLFADVAPDAVAHDFETDDDERFNVFERLIGAAKEEPEAVIGHLTAIVYFMADTIVYLGGKVSRLRKDLDSHSHETGVVVKY